MSYKYLYAILNAILSSEILSEVVIVTLSMSVKWCACDKAKTEASLNARHGCATVYVMAAGYLNGVSDGKRKAAPLRVWS